MSDTITYVLDNKDSENLWGVITTTRVTQIHPDSPSVPYAVYELMLTLAAHRKEPDEEMPMVADKALQQMVSPPERLAYCKQHDLSVEYFPLHGEITWEIPRRLLVILKLILKWTVQAQTAESFGQLFELCGRLRLTGWFKKTFKKPLSIDLADDCELDDEIEDDEEPSVAAD